MENQSNLKSNNESSNLRDNISESLIENKLKLRKKNICEELNKFNKELKCRMSKSKNDFYDSSISKIYNNYDNLGKEFTYLINSTCEKLKSFENDKNQGLIKKEVDSSIELLKNLTNLRHITNFIQNDTNSLNVLFTYIIDFCKDDIQYLFQSLTCSLDSSKIKSLRNDTYYYNYNSSNMENEPNNIENLFAVWNQINVRFLLIKVRKNLVSL